VTDTIRTTVVAALAEIAPEIQGATIDGSADLLDEYDLDSMDLLNLVGILHDQLGVDVPERDYPALRTLDGAVAYLAAHTSEAPT
jgi:acyl carrier protein